MQPNDKGGDGVPAAPVSTDKADIPIQGETSSTQAELDARIDAELQDLGVPNNLIPKSENETPTENTPTEEEPAAEPESGEPGSEADAETPDEATEPDEEVAEEEPAATEPSDEDLFIEVEDANGVTHKISKIEDLPADFEPKSNRQALEILRDLTNLEAAIEQREADKLNAAAEAERKEVTETQFKAWDKEIDELGKAKRIDAKDQETIDSVFKLMTQINTERARLGNPNMITSFEDAYDKYEAQQAKEAAVSKEQQDNDRAKVKASLIGGTSSPAGSGTPVYVSGSYRDIDDVPL